MAKSKTAFVCCECGYESGKWMGKCPECNQWNTLSEQVILSVPAMDESLYSFAHPILLGDVMTDGAQRLNTGMQEFNRVLGGGLVAGSTVLISGDPGIGKSTLLLQVCQTLSQYGSVIYASGEESPAQIKLRAKRLGIKTEGIYLLCESDLENIETQIHSIKPAVVVIDSVQTVYRRGMSSAPGSVSQVREATATLTRIAKATGVAAFLVGHVTKEGNIAGPRVLEHLVDTVLYFEGDRNDAYRLLRAVKNRFGSTNEIGVFEMCNSGMEEVTNPSALFLSHREEPVPGCAVVCSIEGTRPVMAEVQALTCYTAFGNPRRTSAGIDYNRMVLLAAVLEKKVGLRLFDQDIYVNVAGGLKIDERAADLAVIAAIASSLRNKSIQRGSVAIGEVGLTGEVRAVANVEKRIAECCKLGFSRIVMPKINASIQNFGVQIISVKNVSEALEALLE